MAKYDDWKGKNFIRMVLIEDVPGVNKEWHEVQIKLCDPEGIFPNRICFMRPTEDSVMSDLEYTLSVLHDACPEEMPKITHTTATKWMKRHVIRKRLGMVENIIHETEHVTIYDWRSKELVAWDKEVGTGE